MVEHRETVLTSGQQQALDMFGEFLKSDPGEGGGSIRAMLLKGYAGVGKTFMTQYFIDYFRDMFGKSRPEVVVCAPTHKALKQIQDSFKGSDLSSYTLHQLLGLNKVRVDNKGDLKFEQSPKKQKLPSGKWPTLLVVDEVSMVDDSIYQLLISTIVMDLYRCQNFYILFVGDPMQLPPVSRSESLVFDHPTPFSVEMTEVVRQAKENEIIATSIKIRENLDSSSAHHHIRSGQHVTVFSKSNADMVTEFLNLFSEASDTDDAKILAFRNATVAAANARVRKHLYGEDTQELLPGEVLVAHKAKMVGKTMIYQNSDYITVGEDVVFEDYFAFGEMFKTIVFDICKVNGNADVSLETSGVSKIYCRIIASCDADRFKDAVQFNKSEILKLPYDERGAGWATFFKQLEEFDELTQAYALTVHKSQGSTFKDTVLLLSDILRNPDVRQRNRMLYTALTRTANRCYIVQD